MREQSSPPANANTDDANKDVKKENTVSFMPGVDNTLPVGASNAEIANQDHPAAVETNKNAPKKKVKISELISKYES